MSEADLQPRAERPRRRVFTNEYKLAIVAEYDALTEPGAPDPFVDAQLQAEYLSTILCRTQGCARSRV